MSTLSQIHNPETKVQFKQIVIATDFSRSSRCALTYALSLAHRYSSTLSVVHAMAPEPREPIPLEPLPRELNVPRLDAEREMHQLAENARLNIVNHHLIIKQGPVWDVLSSIIERANVDLLVLRHARTRRTEEARSGLDRGASVAAGAMPGAYHRSTCPAPSPGTNPV